MDVRSVTTPSFPVLSRTQVARPGGKQAEESNEAREQRATAEPRHPALSAEEQRYFESAFPAPAQDQPAKSTYSGGGAVRQQSRPGTIVDRKV